LDHDHPSDRLLCDHDLGNSHNHHYHRLTTILSNKANHYSYLLTKATTPIRGKQLLLAPVE
jgi:hypothetical protein